MSSVGFGSKGETPPRMWRKLLLMLVCNVQNRNTSTYVEKTDLLASEQSASKKHLHVCGENLIELSMTVTPTETPPRMWRKLSL